MPSQLSPAQILSKLLAPAGLAALRRKELDRLLAQNAVMKELLSVRCGQGGGRAKDHSIAGIVFSRDRALQLHALLTSFYDQVADPPALQILYACSDGRHQDAYREVEALFARRGVSWRRQQDFRSDLLAMLDAMDSARLFFLVDDLLFIRPLDFRRLTDLPTDRYLPSLRLAPHLSYCYTRQKPQPTPALSRLVDAQTDLLCWRWGDGALDWAYPLSLDGNVFAGAEIAILARRSSFSSPNSLEKALQQFRPIFQLRQGVCFPRSILVNLPINRVQTDNDNLAGQLHQDDLLVKWRDGYRMDVKALYGAVNISAHQELPVSWRPAERKTS